jgi:hypothetical protein
MFIQVAIDIAVSGACQFASGPVNSLADGAISVVKKLDGFALEGMSKVMGPQIAKHFGEGTKMFTSYMSKSNQWAQDGFQSAFNAELNRYSAEAIGDQSTKPKAQDIDESAWVTSSPSKHPLCRDLDIGGQNMDKENKKSLGVGIADFLGRIRQAQRGSYTRIYRGFVPEEGGPSLLSAMLTRLVKIGESLDKSAEAEYVDAKSS